MKLEEALERIYSMHQFNIKLGLEKTVHLMNYLGNPHKKLNSIHIGGSNGKGSTSSFISSILMEYGYKTALFTSPHFVKFNERVRINGEMIPDDYITDFISSCDSYIRKNEPTFFELTTAMAFKYFAEMNPDYCVIEVGLGGRLDSTNVLNPLASVITSISLEHTNILGTEIGQIAAEKAGIIKNDRKTFIGKLPQEAEDVILQTAREKNNNFYSVVNYITEYNDYINLKIDKNIYNLYETPLKGYHQLLNSSLALLTLEKTLNLNDNEKNLKGIENVISHSGFQGRYEIYNKEPRVIFDAAHNLEGVEWFIREFRKEYKNYDKKILIFGVMKDKDYDNMLKLLNPFFDEIRFSAIENERAVSALELKNTAKAISNNVFIENNPSEYLTNYIKDKEKNNCLVLLGSIYLLGKIKEEIQKMA